MSRLAPLPSLTLLVLALTAPGCGGAPREVDYADLLVAGVDPPAEAERVIAFLRPVELLLETRVEVGSVIALGFVRERDAHRAIRVVTPRGVTVALDSHGDDGVALRDGAIEIDEARSGGDLDGDGRLEVVVARQEPERRCLLLLEVGDDGEVEPLSVDATDLDPTLCLEALRDVDGNGTIEAILGVRAHRLARAAVPHVELPLERDEAGVYRRTPPAVSFVTAETSRLDAALLRARATGDVESCYTHAVSRALLERVVGHPVEAQLTAFDEAIAGTVWTDELAGVLIETRQAILDGRW